jgi:predicted transcriptional regulator of viral defense system/very-short-patch-repair endonuclease
VAVITAEIFAKSEHSLDAAIAIVATPQQSIVTHDQLLDIGLTEAMIRYRIKIGRLHRLHQGVYAVGCRPISPYAHALAAVFACGPGAVLSHDSAATLWTIKQHWSSPLEVTARSQRRPARLRVHRSKMLTARDVTVHFGIPVTSPAQTLFDIAGRLDDATLARAFNDLRLARYLSLDEAAELLDRHPTARAAKRLNKHVDGASPHPTRSRDEDDFPAFARRYDLPPFEVNTRVAGHEVDILFREHKLAVELDGWEFHSARTAFEDDRDRDADLLAAGIATVRVTRDRLRLAPDREAARLHAILAGRALSR